MSVVDFRGEKVHTEADKSALAVRDAIASMDVDELRSFIVNLMRANRVPAKRIAKVFGCSARTIRRYGEAIKDE